MSEDEQGFLIFIIRDFTLLRKHSLFNVFLLITTVRIIILAIFRISIADKNQ